MAHLSNVRLHSESGRYHCILFQDQIILEKKFFSKFLIRLAHLRINHLRNIYKRSDIIISQKYGSS